MIKSFLSSLSVLFLLLLVSSPVYASSRDAALAERAVSDAIRVYEDLEDYTAVFHKHEKKEGDWLHPESFLMKFKKPFSVYMMGLKGPHKGYGMLYVDGKYNNKILVHVSGFMNIFMPSFILETNNHLMMKNNRHGVNDVGIGYFINSMRTEFLTALDRDEVEVEYLGEVEENNELGHKFALRYNSKGTNEYYTPFGEVVFSQSTKLPMHIWIYQTLNKKSLIEEYQYWDMQVNTGLSDRDFDAKNPDYNFGTVLGDEGEQ